MMTIGRLRARMRRMRDDIEQEAEESGELNLVPYLDIVSNLVMFLLATITFTATLGNVNVTAPTYSDEEGAAVEIPDTPPLNLTLQVSERGFTVAGSGAVMKNPQTGGVPTLEKTGGKYPYEALTRLISRIKAKWQKETRVIFVANPEIEYDHVIRTLDAVRKDSEGRLLFPDVVFSSGVARAL